MTTSAREQSALLADLLRRERIALAEFLVALADFDRRRLWLELGYASLFSYLNQDLGLSKGASFYRLTAARLIQNHPEVVEPLRDGRLCLTSIVALSKILDAGNREQVLPRFFHLSKREAQAIMAELRPADAVPHRDVVTAVRTPPALDLAPTSTTSAPPDAPAVEAAAGTGSDFGQALHPANRCGDLGQSVHPANLGAAFAPAAGPPPPVDDAPVVVEPMTANLGRLHVTVSRRFLTKLEAARAALSHSHPGAGAAEILEAGLELLIERHAKRRGLVEKPRKSSSTQRSAPASRQARGEWGVPRLNDHGGREESGGDCESRAARAHIPAHVKREVWKRDGGRCQWPLESGGICGSTLRIQLDHVLPRARGGLPTVENLRCLCRVHNDLAARQVYGDGFMDHYAKRLPPSVRRGAWFEPSRS